MQPLQKILQICHLFFLVASAVTASTWGFTDATVSVQGKGTGVGGGFKEKYENLALGL